MGEGAIEMILYRQEDVTINNNIAMATRSSVPLVVGVEGRSLVGFIR